MKLEPYIVVESEDGLKNPGCLRCILLIRLGRWQGFMIQFHIPDAPGADSHSLWKEFANKIGDYVDKYVKAMEKVKLKKGLECAMKISGEKNAYLQIYLVTNQKQKLEVMEGRKVTAARDSSCVLSPYSYHLRKIGSEDVLFKVTFDESFTQGGFSSAMVVHQNYVVNIPDKLSPEQVCQEWKLR
nr:probable UDP-N-acetylglucosamine--peptide N-acetylglucosaminyltransferase SPINDLY [Tanacetum cinerariifolium]